MDTATKLEKVVSVEGISEYRMANGLTVLLLPDRARATITVNMTYRVGSRHEGYGETGMAHLLEHLMFKGSPGHSNVAQEMTSRGADANGTTTYDHTNYYETFPAGDKNLRWALDLEADRMVNAFISGKHLESEMTVVRNELEAHENDPAEILRSRVRSTAYLWHAYGRETIGARSDIENVRIERLQAFWRTYYQPDNAVLVLTGNFEEENALEWIVQAFGKISRPTRELPSTYTVEPPQDGEREVVLRGPSDVQVVSVAYHVPAAAHPDAAAVKFLVPLLGHTPSGRLHKALVETGRAVSTSSGFQILCEPGLFVARATVRRESSLEQARYAMLSTLDGVIKNPPSEDEVERARAKLLGTIEQLLRSSERVGLFLSDLIGIGDWRLLFLDRERIRNVTQEDVRRVAAAYLKPSNRTVGRLIPTENPDRAEISAAPAVAAALEGCAGNVAIVEGEAFDPTPSNIESRTTRSQLSGGLKLALLPKKTRGAAVVARLTLRLGDEKSLMNREAAASLAGDMLARGTAKRTREQIRDELDRLQAIARINGGLTRADVSIQATRQSFPAVLELAAECLREPSFPAGEFEIAKQESLAATEECRSDPQNIVVRADHRHLLPFPKGDVRYTSTPDEEIADISGASLEQAKAFHQDFYGASNGELAVVGDFDAKVAEDLAGELFGSWKSPIPFARVPHPFRDVPPVSMSFETPDKANAYFRAEQNLPVSDGGPEYPALELGNFMIGGGFLNSRLSVRIREKEGLSYSVSSDIDAWVLDQSGSWRASAICAPQNMARLEAAFREEIDRVLEEGFEAREVEEAKSGWLRSREVARGHDSHIAAILAAGLYFNRTFAWKAEFEENVLALTAEEILGALRKHIDPAKLSIFKAGDFARVAVH